VGQPLEFIINTYDANNNSAWMASQYGAPQQLRLTTSALAIEQSIGLLQVVADAVPNTGAVAGSVNVTRSMSSIVPGQMHVVVVPTRPGLYTIRVINTTSFVTSQANSSVKYFFSSADATPGNTFQITVVPSVASALSAAVVAARSIEAGGSTAINVALKDASSSPLLDANFLLLNVTVFSTNQHAAHERSLMVCCSNPPISHVQRFSAEL
jgi:hypothetical protein